MSSNKIFSSKNSAENEIKYYLLKDFKNQVSQSDFLILKDEPGKNFGIFDDVFCLMNKNNKKIYFLKIIDKKDIINQSYQKILNIIYNLNYSNKNNNSGDYIINLQTQWEKNDKLFLIFDSIKKYSSLDDLIKNYSENITEENILLIFKHILESVNILHENNIYGCNLNLNSFIYDMESKTIKLTDPGFSKIFKSLKNIKDNKLENGFEFNEYIPPELITRMTDSPDLILQEKMKNMQYDIWQLGILFYKIATFGKSPYSNLKDEELRKSILNKNLIYSSINKYSNKIVQIIDKMLQRTPTERAKIKDLLNLDYFKISDKKPVINFEFINDNKIVDMDMINKEKEKIKDVKIDMFTVFDSLEAKTRNSNKEIEIIGKKSEDDKNENNNKNLLKNISVQGNIVNNKNIVVLQEIFPDGSVIPSFQKKFLNKFNDIDNDLVINLSNKLALLEREYKNIEETKLAIKNITNYINDKITEKNINDNKEFDSLIKIYKNIKSKKNETLDLFEEIKKNKENIPEGKIKILISNLLTEIKNLDIELNHEKELKSVYLNKINEFDKIIENIKSDYQEKIKFYEEKIDVLEDVIFNVENTNMNKNDMINNNKLIYQALTNSMKSFTEINLKLRQNLEEGLSKYDKDNNDWINNLVKAKDNLRDEIKYCLEKEKEKENPKIITLDKKDNKDTLIKNKKDEKIEELTKKNKESIEIINNLKSKLDQSTTTINQLNEKLLNQEKQINELNKLLNK
jgi:serine/threonine protein kinase